VLTFGGRLAETNGADLEVLELFAVFHDSRRTNESVDHGHGVRGAELAERFHGRYFQVAPEQLEILLAACRDHTRGGVSDHPTIGTCWDADRLDLWRVGIYPDPTFMCTEEARSKEVIEWAVSHSALA
jgi:uncharacterized protein